jgi:hypothetical protein
MLEGPSGAGGVGTRVLLTASVKIIGCGTGFAIAAASGGVSLSSPGASWK